MSEKGSNEAPNVDSTTTNDILMDTTINLDDSAEILDEPVSEEVRSPLENLEEDIDNILQSNSELEETKGEDDIFDDSPTEFTESNTTINTLQDIKSEEVIVEQSIDLESPLVPIKPIVEPEIVQGVQNLELSEDDIIEQEIEKSNEFTKQESLEWPVNSNDKEKEENMTGVTDPVITGSLEETNGRASNYFKTHPAPTSDATGADFFDQISQSAPSTGEKEVIKPVETVHTIPARNRTISENSQEPTSITFDTSQEDQEKLRKIASTDSVSKFFKSAEASSSENDNKNFFDTFAGGIGSPTSDLPNELVRESPDELQMDVTLPASPRNVPTTPPLPPNVSPQMLNMPMSFSPKLPPIGDSHETSGAPSIPSPTEGTAPQTPPIQPSPVNPNEDASATQVFRQTSGEDLFSASLQMSSSDRMHDAWIPSEATRQILVKMVTSPPGSYIPEETLLTRPGLLVDTPQGDPVKELVRRHLGEEAASKRQSLSASDVSHDEAGLRKLIEAGCWREGVDLTGQLLTNFGQGIGKCGMESLNTPTTIQFWFCRFALLVKLRQYSLAESECAAFGNLDQPDMYYEFYTEQYPGRKGSLVPFGMRLLHAELPHYLGKSQEALDRLFYIMAIVTKILTNLGSGLSEEGAAIELSDDTRQASVDLWRKREIKLLYTISNVLLSIKDYTSCIEILQTLLTKDEKNQAAISSSIGRIFLQMGQLNLAEQQFQGIKDGHLASGGKKDSTDLLNEGFLHLGKGSYKEAFELFKSASELDPNNAVAVNNMAVCALYTGKLTSALEILEHLVRNNPAKYLQDGILFNLCTLHELESSKAIQKKQGLLELVSQHKGNGFNAACLKMS
ncbi:unnamed protein product [Owenia fusiformis]|uniref:Uncharacterized protein n=1 Tax=Owenia fusiformis TaxID=6347 RepID=A0A8J1Y0N0_OWEFU|nr:unnamed protein product [Owenia fusiformis]